VSPLPHFAPLGTSPRHLALGVVMPVPQAVLVDEDTVAQEGKISDMNSIKEVRFVRNGRRRDNLIPCKMPHRLKHIGDAL
jgi:hypothetical protein